MATDVIFYFLDRHVRKLVHSFTPFINISVDCHMLGHIKYTLLETTRLPNVSTVFTNSLYTVIQKVC